MVLSVSTLHGQFTVIHEKAISVSHLAGVVVDPASDAIAGAKIERCDRGWLNCGWNNEQRKRRMLVWARTRKGDLLFAVDGPGVSPYRGYRLGTSLRSRRSQN